MPPYNTGNPIGSDDPRDLSDNARHLDQLTTNRTIDYAPDRFGALRLSWAGMERQFAATLASVGYVELGAYQAGLVISKSNEIFSRGDDFYRPAPSLLLPYTLTGNWANESVNFVSVGDASTRAALATSAGASMIGTDSVGNRSLQEKLDEVVSIADKGGVSDGVTGDGNAWTATENDPDISVVYLNPGLSPTGGLGLAKALTGPGSAMNINGFKTPGMGAYDQKPWHRGMTGPNMNQAISQPMTIAFVGDSNTQGDGLTREQSWPWLVQERAGRKMTSRQGSNLSGADFERFQFGGTVTDAYSGPLGSQAGGKTLAPGAWAQVTASWIDLIRFSFQRAPGAGSITVTDQASGQTVLGPVDCSGAGAGTINSSFSGIIKGRGSRPYRFTNTGSGPVTLNGHFMTHLVPLSSNTPLIFMQFARGGTTSRDYAAPGVLESMVTQMPYPNRATLVLMVGENDKNRAGVYPAGSAFAGQTFTVTADVYEANLRYIVPTWRALTGGGDVYLGVPMDNRFAPLSGDLATKYRDAVYRVCRELNATPLDLSEYDFQAAGVKRSDEVHMLPAGAQAIADFVWDKLKLSQIACEDFVEALTPQGSGTFSTSIGGVTFASPASRLRHEECLMTGMLSLDGVTPGGVVFSQSIYTAPTVRKIFTVGLLATDGTYTSDTATLLLDANGFAAMLGRTGTTGRYAPLDGIRYNTFE